MFGILKRVRIFICGDQRFGFDLKGFGELMYFFRGNDKMKVMFCKDQFRVVFRMDYSGKRLEVKDINKVIIRMWIRESEEQLNCFKMMIRICGVVRLSGFRFVV